MRCHALCGTRGEGDLTELSHGPVLGSKRIKTGVEDWRDGLVLKSTCCSVVRTRVQIQASTPDGSQMPRTPVPKDRMSSSDFCSHTCGHMNRDVQAYSNGENNYKETAAIHCVSVFYKHTVFEMP